MCVFFYEARILGNERTIFCMNEKMASENKPQMTSSLWRFSELWEYIAPLLPVFPDKHKF